MSPALLILQDEAEYRQHYEKNYCRAPIVTFDGIPVYFAKSRFDHAFFESSDRRGSKDLFSPTRAQRMGWIKLTLQNPKAEIYQGWDAKKNRYRSDSRVAFVYESFVVVIRLSLRKDGTLKGNFITCYQADNSIGKIRKSPHWEKTICLETLKKKGGGR